MMAWKEELSRDIARVLMEQYSSVADALFELVDNPIDFRRRGRVPEITVEIDRERGSRPALSQRSRSSAITRRKSSLAISAGHQPSQ